MTDPELELDAILAFLDHELLLARAQNICLAPIRFSPDVWSVLLTSPDPRLTLGSDGTEPILRYTSDFGAVTLIETQRRR